MTESEEKQLQQQLDNASVSELTITIKDEEKTHRVKHLVYGPYLVHHNDEIIKGYVDQALSEFKGDPSTIRVKISLEIL